MQTPGVGALNSVCPLFKLAELAVFGVSVFTLTFNH